ncbi:MAG TPA: hypothetical protein PKY82_07055 [Pyrinomonadaceae bacterium]|nr:hypothetical protein [Pyrinomonadaceae bacterium]
MGKKFLIGQLARFGDCLYATTLAKQIKYDYPDSHITWAIAENYKSILELNPYIDRIWAIPLAGEDYAQAGWDKFETEALERQANGEFDEVIFSQIPPRNWIRFDGTIRRAILNSYEKPITVSVEPVIQLSEAEVNRVKSYAEKNKLADFKNVVLFECAPGSGQSNVNIDFALRVARTIVEKNKDVSFILSTNQKSDFASPQIIDASELTFRENAELTKYCTFLIGCSSGITWISTSDWAKKLPMLQLLNEDLIIYAGIHFDFELNNLDFSQVIEMTNFDESKVVDCVESILSTGIEKNKPKFHQNYKPTYHNLSELSKAIRAEERSFKEVLDFIKNYVATNRKVGNRISLKYLFLIAYSYYHCNIRASKEGFFFQIRKFFKFIICKKSHSLPE